MTAAIMNTAPEKVFVHIGMTPSLHRTLAIMAAERGETKSCLVRDLIRREAAANIAASARELKERTTA